LGVVGPPPQPLIPIDAITAIKIALLMASSRRRTFRFDAPKRGNSRNAASAPAIAIERCKGDVAGVGRAGVEREASDRRAAEGGFTLVAMVRVEVAVPAMAGVMDVGEKVQVVSVGRLPQLRFVALAKPLVEVTVIVATAVAPPLSELLDGERVNENVGGPGHTVTATADEVDDALSASPA
jgi:hypothetical protein